MAKAKRIIFMGTPEFAVPSLEALHESVHEVVAVVTQPDRPKGRGRKLTPSPVKRTAAGFGYRILQPKQVREPEFEEEVAALAPDFLVVIAYGHILHEALLELPKTAAVNIHASLLPKYRGPAPIQWAIINGEERTGVTSMFMAKGMDTGDMLISATTPITGEDTSGTLHDRLSAMSADLLLSTLARFGEIRPTPQNPEEKSYAPLLKKSDGNLDWTQSAKALECRIRGVTPWPGAYTYCNDRRFKIFKAEALMEVEADAPPGTVLKGFPEEIRVATGEGVLSILEIQGESCKRMPVKNFLTGSGIPPGARFSREPVGDMTCTE